jgi:hypothetical protein
MLISHVHQFIYLKTRKTAGTSVEMAFQPWAAGNSSAEVVEKTHAKVSVNGIIGSRMIRNADYRPADKIWYNHMPAEEIERRMAPRLWERYLKFAVVRNPFDKVVSNFHRYHSGRFLAHGRANQSPPEPVDAAETRALFRDYVLNQEWRTDEEVVTLRGARCVDVLLRYECLRNDIDQLATRLEIDPTKVLLPVTKDGKALRKAQPLDAYYDAETIDKVRLKLGWMFDWGGYPDTPAAWDDRMAGGTPS